MRQVFVAVVTRLSVNDLDVRSTLPAMRLSTKTNGTEVPRNVSLLFFTEDPDQYLPGTTIEVARFRDPQGGDLIESQTIRGPLPGDRTS